jgi:hypothetical protein
MIVHTLRFLRPAWLLARLSNRSFRLLLLRLLLPPVWLAYRLLLLLLLVLLRRLSLLRRFLLCRCFLLLLLELPQQQQKLLPLRQRAKPQHKPRSTNNTSRDRTIPEVLFSMDVLPVTPPPAHTHTHRGQLVGKSDMWLCHRVKNAFACCKGTRAGGLGYL